MQDATAFDSASFVGRELPTGLARFVVGEIVAFEEGGDEAEVECGLIGVEERFQEKVAQEEAEVEGGVAVVAGFKIDNGDALKVNEDVLGAEITQDEATAVVVRVFDEALEGIAIIGMVAPEATVVGIEAEFVEHGEVAETIGD